MGLKKFLKSTKGKITLFLIVILFAGIFIIYQKPFLKNLIFNVDCNDALNNYYDYKIDNSYEIMMGLFKETNCTNIDLKPDHCKDCLDYASPHACYNSKEDMFWVIQSPGFGRIEDTKFYGPFEGYPCVDYRRG